MSRYLICIGGTGQIMLHYYFQLFWLNIIKEPFTAYIIDTDELIPSLKKYWLLLNKLQYGSAPKTIFGSAIPQIIDLSVRVKSEGKVSKLLTGIEPENLGDHPVTAFFSEDSLNQSIQEGLFYRPALSSIVLESEYIKKLEIESDSKVIFVGSIIGGTGGGLLTPVVDLINQITSSKQRSVTLKAVLFGEYFRPESLGNDDLVLRFKSNQILVLKTIEKALDNLHSFYIVGGPKANHINREKDAEKKPNMNWPASSSISIDPYWEGLQAIEYLFVDSTKAESQKPEEKEYQIPSLETINYQESISKLENSVTLLNTINKKNVLRRMSKDHWKTTIWGESLTRLFRSLFQLAASLNIKIDYQQFADDLQEEISDIWLKREKISDIFPIIVEDKKILKSPNNIRNVPWPTNKLKEIKVSSYEEFVNKAAVTIVYYSIYLKESK